MTDQSPITGSVLFYSQPEPLNAQTHGKLGMNANDKPYAFAREGHIVPAVVTEFAPAALSFPIIFIGEKKLPVAVMGINAGENLFVKDDGGYLTGAYIPGFLRRYPFVLANDDTEKRMVVCIDRPSKLIQENAETPFFDANGQPTEFTQNAIKFCDDFELERMRTESFVQLLTDLDLFETKQAHYTPFNTDGTRGEPQVIAEYFAVSEDKLKALPTEKLVELRDNGALGQIYAHLTSLLGWERLIAMQIEKRLGEGGQTVQ
ncbi:SapC family protein [Caulobacter segnis]|uniref:SapC family protein n=1 Tax=Caulobacter segnis TaxID=88688 RepID=UPI00240F7C54|nr:SapC family protein [Caulobacter segnis]MDG2520806.1 SapC family protein [Caulobacter segnis]